MLIWLKKKFWTVISIAITHSRSLIQIALIRYRDFQRKNIFCHICRMLRRINTQKFTCLVIYNYRILKYMWELLDIIDGNVVHIPPIQPNGQVYRLRNVFHFLSCCKRTRSVVWVLLLGGVDNGARKIWQLVMNQILFIKDSRNRNSLIRVTVGD